MAVSMIVWLVAVTVLGAAPVDPGWRPPLDGPVRVVRSFDPPARPWLPGHRGVDLAAAVGRPVRAAGAGVVTFARRLAGRGVVVVRHAGGLRTTYLPVRPSVRPGQPVRAGEALGTLEDRPGHCPAACLHWGLRRGADYLDPLSLIGAGPVRLLPVWPASPAGGQARGWAWR